MKKSTNTNAGPSNNITAVLTQEHNQANQQQKLCEILATYASAIAHDQRSSKGFY